MTLERLLEEVSRQNMCVRWGCTTCGSLQFRKVVAAHLNSTEPLSPSDFRRLTAELASLDVVRDLSAVEFLIRWAANSISEQELASMLGENATGRHYRDMRTARDRADERRREHDRRNAREFIEANRLAKKHAKAAAHAERLKNKALRDAERKLKGAAD
jgi:hypothetical protein